MQQSKLNDEWRQTAGQAYQKSNTEGKIMKKEKISFIIPLHNEEENIARVYEAIEKEMEHTRYQYEVLFINDGSRDGSADEIEQLSFYYETVKYISFTRNFGKESALLAGLEHACGDAIIMMDADLQHPPALISELLSGYEEGYDQVVAKRNRKGDSRIKSFLSSGFYKCVSMIVDVPMADGEGDFRLLSRRAVEALLKLSEGNRFSKGLYSWIGFEKKTICYENVARENGTSKWGLSSLLNYGIDGIVSFNNKPLRACFYLGAFVLLLSLLYICATFIDIMRDGIEVPGYFTIISAILFLGGIQLVCLGIIGEYVGRIYYETKKRPHYLIQRTNIKHESEDRENHAIR